MQKRNDPIYGDLIALVMIQIEIHAGAACCFGLLESLDTDVCKPFLR